MRTAPVTLTVLIVGSLGVAAAQAVRETGTASVAGIVAAAESFDDYTFQSRGGEILFADVDSAIYQTQGRGARAAKADDATGFVNPYPDDDDDDDSDDCSADDDGGLCLQVLDEHKLVVCWAARPAGPGPRDPAVACPLPLTVGEPRNFTLRVARRAAGSDCGPAATFAPGVERLYLLNISLRTTMSGGPLAAAIEQSENRFSDRPSSD